MTALTFRVFGTPAPAGSKTVVPTARGPRVLDGGSKAAREHRRTWRSDVIDAARTAMTDADWRTVEGPVALTLALIVPRPKSLPRQRRDGTVPQPITRPDLTKLLRATEDAITAAGVWRDDSQVVRLVVDKVYEDLGYPPGAIVTVAVLA